jgi:mRNA interferase RelE/StbE
MIYDIQLTTKAKKQLKKLDKKQQIRIIAKLDYLAKNPRSHGVKKSVGYNAYRYRVGDYRIIYEIVEKSITVIVLNIDHRKQVYN